MSADCVACAELEDRVIKRRELRICKKLNISLPPDIATPAKEDHPVESIANYLIIVLANCEEK